MTHLPPDPNAQPAPHPAESAVRGPSSTKIAIFAIVGGVVVAIVGIGAFVGLIILLASNAPYQVKCEGSIAGYTSRKDADQDYAEKVADGQKNCRKVYKD